MNAVAFFVLEKCCWEEMERGDDMCYLGIGVSLKTLGDTDPHTDDKMMRTQSVFLIWTSQDCFLSLAKLSPPFPLCAPLVWFTLLFACPVSTFLPWQRQKLPACLFAILLILARDSQLAISPHVLIQTSFNISAKVLMLSWTRHKKSAVCCMFHEGHGPLMLSWQQKRSQCMGALGWMSDLYGCHFAVTTKKT